MGIWIELGGERKDIFSSVHLSLIVFRHHVYCIILTFLIQIFILFSGCILYLCPSSASWFPLGFLATFMEKSRLMPGTSLYWGTPWPWMELGWLIPLLTFGEINLSTSKFPTWFSLIFYWDLCIYYRKLLHHYQLLKIDEAKNLLHHLSDVLIETVNFFSNI